MFCLLLFLFVIINSCKEIETIQLEYKLSFGQNLIYSQIEITERHDNDKNLDKSIEYIEMNYTEKLIEIDSIKTIERKINSIRIIPNNQYKLKQLLETTYRQFNEELISHPVQLSSIDGHILLSSPNQPKFPEYDIKINESWIIPIMNSLGEIHYKLISIDENKLAKIEFEGSINMSPSTSLTGKWSFDIERGITLMQQIISSSSLLSDYTITKTIIQKLLSIN